MHTLSSRAPIPFAVSILLVSLVLIPRRTSALENGMARTPAIGWSTWCGMGPCGNDYCSEDYVMSAATAMLANGMHALGYRWIVMDDCWAAESRAADGSITWDTERFPHGIPFLANWMHERNFSFGLYTSAGNTTCSSGGLPKPIPGSEGHYIQDANTFASWNLDYVKVDWCGDVKNMPLDGIAVGAKDYKAFSAALTNSTPPRHMYFEGVAAMLFLLWDVEQYVNAWRASTDHHDQWSNTMEVLATVEVLEFPSVPGAWSYMDVLMTGGEGCSGPNQHSSSAHCPGMTDEEYRTEFTLWSMYQSPLMVATDVRNITSIMHELLFNRRVLQIHQDTRTPPGKKVGADASCGELDLACQLYARPLADGSALVALFNTDASTTHNITIPFSLVSPTWSASSVATVEDLWGNAHAAPNATATGSFTASVLPHSSVYVVLHPVS
jgi:alpha-galactosidase